MVNEQENGTNDPAPPKSFFRRYRAVIIVVVLFAVVVLLVLRHHKHQQELAALHSGAAPQPSRKSSTGATRRPSPQTQKPSNWTTAWCKPISIRA